MIPAVANSKTDLPAPAGRNSVRIIAGAWRGRRVHFPDMPGLRPTPDRVRETLFNWLQHSIADTRVLDLFAGSGALGLEALSRGAREAVFVEQFPAAARSLQEQLVRFGGAAKGRILGMGAARFLRASGEPFDVVFLDPPFGTNPTNGLRDQASPRKNNPRAQDRSHGEVRDAASTPRARAGSAWSRGPSRPSTFRPPEGRIGASSLDEGQFSRECGAGART